MLIFDIKWSIKMKKIIYILIIISLLITCKSNSDPNLSESSESINKSWKIVGDGNIYNGKMTDFSFTISDNNVPYIAYYEEEPIGNYTGIVKKLSGNIWEKLANNSFSEKNAALDISIIVTEKDIPYITYLDVNNKAYLITLKNNNWEAACNVSDFNNVKNISLSSSSFSAPYIAYEKSDSVSAGKCSGDKWESLGKIQNTSSAYAPYIAVSKDIPYVAYIDYDKTTKKHFITLKKYANSTWETVGAEKFAETFYSSKLSLSLALAVYDNIPYIAYSDKNNNYKATVMKYEGGSWKLVGAEGFSKQGINNISLKISEDGVLYVSYLEKVNISDAVNNSITVMKFADNNWQSVGKEGFTKGEIYSPSLDLSKNGVPYLAYYNDIEKKIIVMKFE